MSGVQSMPILRPQVPPEKPFVRSLKLRTNNQHRCSPNRLRSKRSKVKDEVLAPGFRISGLGQLVDAGIKADRTVTFGD